MPYPMFRSTANSRPVISRPLPLRSYQDLDHDSSRWSMSQDSEYPEEDHARSFWATRLPIIPPRSPLRTRFTRPNAPPALLRTFNAGKEDADLGYYFDESLHTPTTAATTSSVSSAHYPTPSAASAPACHTTFASADPNFNQWLAATVRRQRHITARELTSTTRLTERELPPPPTPPKDADFHDPHQASGRHGRSDDAYDYTHYLQHTSSPLPPPSSLSLCNSSGWSCVARRTARNP
jgi:hypothetical protein